MREELASLGMELMVTMWPFIHSDSVNFQEFDAKGWLALNASSGRHDVMYSYLGGRVIDPTSAAAASATFARRGPSPQRPAAVSAQPHEAPCVCPLGANGRPAACCCARSAAQGPPEQALVARVALASSCECCGMVFRRWFEGYGRFGIRAIWLDETEPDRSEYTYGQWQYAVPPVSALAPRGTSKQGSRTRFDPIRCDTIRCDPSEAVLEPAACCSPVAVALLV